MIKIGPAGNEDAFFEKGYSKTTEMMKYISDMGLSAYEYQCGRGVRVSADTASRLRDEAVKNNIDISLHAPYYISMSSLDEEKRLGSIRYVMESARAVFGMGGKRVIIHTGSCANLPREDALVLAKDTMKLCLNALKEESLYDNINLCPETMGKINQLGTLEEAIELCTLDDSLIPVIDFGHLNARDYGIIKTAQDYNNIFNKIENKLGESRTKSIHIHFSKIEWTKGGEKQHLNFDDKVFGPPFEPLLEVIYKKDLSPVIICESKDTQARDAKIMLDFYIRLNENV